MLAPGTQHMIQYFYTLQNDHHDKSSYHLSWYKVIKILTIFPMLYISSPWLIYFVTGNLYLLISLTDFTHPPHTPPSLWQPPIFPLSISLFLFVHLFCFLDSTYKWIKTVFVFPACLISLSIIPSRCNPFQTTNNSIFHRTRTNNTKICMETQKTPK